MAVRRRGKTTAFWSNAAVGANGVSAFAELGRGIDTAVIYMTVSAATTISVEVAHSSDLTGEGVLYDLPTAFTRGAHTLPTATLTVDNTQGFSDSGSLQIGFNSLAYTGRTSTTFTGVTGGSGTVANDTPVIQTPTFFPLFYQTGAASNKVEAVFAGAGSAALSIPDLAANIVRLRSSGAATITAGFEASGE